MNSAQVANFPGTARIHVGLAVRDVAQSTRFYRILFGEAPVKERPGYAKFEPQDPSVNLSLNQVPEPDSELSLASHFGVQVKSSEAVDEATARFREAGLGTTVEKSSVCCYARQDKVWIVDPDGNRWEIFVVLDPDVSHQKDDDIECCAAPNSPCGEVSCC